jgi:uncharacterized protein YceK
MKKIIYLMLLISMIFTSGCATFFKKDISNDNLKSTREAAGIKERAMTSGNNAREIRNEAKSAVEELDAEVKQGMIDSYMAKYKKERWARVDENAKLIERLAALNAQGGKKIININSGDWYATWWFKGLMIFLGIIVLSVIAGYITYMAKAWGVINYVKYANEGLAEGMAALIDKNEHIDNESIRHNDLRDRMNTSGRYRG